MELILKQPNNKPPFIGIGFSSEHALKGQKMHAEIVEKYPDAMYEVHIEHTPSSLNLRLICRQNMMVYFYDKLGFNPEHLRSWLYLNAKATRFNFGHVSMEFGKHSLMVSQPLRKKFVVPVHKFSMISAEDPDSVNNLPFTTSYRHWG